MKKIFALALAALMTASMATVAFATPDGKYDGITVGVKDANATAFNTVYVLSDSRAENVVDGNKTNEKNAENDVFEGGDRIAIPLLVWDDDDDTDTDKDGVLDSADTAKWYDKDVDYKNPSIKVDWKVGEADVDYELVKFGATVSESTLQGKYVYCAIITLPENKGNKAVDLAGTIKVGANSTSAKKSKGIDIELTYLPDKRTEPLFDGGELTSGKTGIVEFDKDAGEIDIDFEDVATFTVDVSSQGKLNMEWNTTFDKEFGKKYDYANLEFITFEGEPSFNKTGTLYIYAEDKNTFVYEATEDGAKAVKAEWNEDYEAWEIKTRKLTSYVLSDVELDKQTVTEDKNESSKPESDKANPDTGR